MTEEYCDMCPIHHSFIQHNNTDRSPGEVIPFCSITLYLAHCSWIVAYVCLCCNIGCLKLFCSGRMWMRKHLKHIWGWIYPGEVHHIICFVIRFISCQLKDNIINSYAYSLFSSYSYIMNYDNTVSFFGCLNNITN